MKSFDLKKYDTPFYNSRMMGPNPIKLQAELLKEHNIPQGATVLDLGCGRGITSAFLAKECKARVFAADLWIEPTENKKFFDEAGISSHDIIPLHTDANCLPFAQEFFDCIVITDSYHYFGRDPNYLAEKLLPLLKHKGTMYIAVPGMKKDCHENLPPELLATWSPEDLDTIHDAEYWKNLIGQTSGIENLQVFEMQQNQEVWEDWLQCDNEYAISDRIAFAAGAGNYLNFVAIVLTRM